jgi:hypothetical protein
MLGRAVRGVERKHADADRLLEFMDNLFRVIT